MAKKRKKKRNMVPVAVACLVLLLLLAAAVYELLLPAGPVFSERENRILSEKPAFSWKAFFDGSFADDLERYLADRFPGRMGFIDFTRELRQVGSLATWEEYSLVAESDVADMQDPGEVEEAQPMVTPRPTRTPAPTPTATPEPTPAPTPDPQATLTPTDTPEPTPTPVPTPTPRPTKPPASANDFPGELRVDLLDGTSKRRSYAFMRYKVQRQCSLFDAYASLLPEDGIFAITIVPNAYRANRLLALDDPKGMVSEVEPFIHAMTANNVAAFSTADILSAPMLAGEYVYFRSDMHWTPYGAYLVVSEMLAEAGETLPPYDAFPKTQEHPFLGTLYRDSLNKQMEANPDTLDILTPIRPTVVRRYTTPQKYDEVPFIDDNASPRDRYTVYLGGPKGNWTVVERTDIPEESFEKTCLVISDSYGLCTMPFFAQAYDRAILYDARYYERYVMGAVSGLIESWGVQDIYMILGDAHFSEETFCRLCNAEF